jgi:ferritin-like metal-binding protein YciE
MTTEANFPLQQLSLKPSLYGRFSLDHLWPLLGDHQGQETEIHVSRLKQLIGDVNDDVDDKKDPILTAIAGSGKNISKETDSGPIRDAGLIATAQKIEHYEIASYGSARDWATQLGLAEHASTLQTTLEEEKHADQLLSQLSRRANRDASSVAA